jgi:flagellar protein FliL
VAEEKSSPEVASAPAPSGQKPILFIALAVINMVIVLVVGWMMWKGKQKEAEKPTLDQVISGEHETQKQESESEKSFVGKVVPLESFTVNLAQSKGRRVIKVDLELEIEGDKVSEEIEKRKPQIRDIIIITLSSKTYEEVSSRDGKESLRSEIKDTINNFLTQGRIKNVLFTGFIYN